jgi:hypothetical protein
MVTVKEAAKKAIEYLLDLNRENLSFANVLVEEVEQTDGHWLITLGYNAPSILAQFGGKGNRDFKIFKVDRQTGEVVSMKIREVEHVE